MECFKGGGDLWNHLGNLSVILFLLISGFASPKCLPKPHPPAPSEALQDAYEAIHNFEALPRYFHALSVTGIIPCRAAVPPLLV